MAAIARNAVVLLVLLAAVVQLCSVVPPAAAAGRVLQDVVQQPLVQGGLGGDAKPDTCVTGGGNVGPSGVTVVKGSLWCQREKLVDQQGSVSLDGLTTVNTAPIP
ncbi:unnamed protein product [Urochloa humidicola]